MSDSGDSDCCISFPGRRDDLRVINHLSLLIRSPHLQLISIFTESALGRTFSSSSLCFTEAESRHGSRHRRLRHDHKKMWFDILRYVIIKLGNALFYFMFRGKRRLF